MGKIDTILEEGLKRPEKILLSEEGKDLFDEIVEALRRKGKIT